VAQFDPWQIALELARVKGPWRAAIGATFKHWSAYPGPVEATVRCPETDPSTGEPFGPCGALVPAPVDYSDTVVPRAGVEREIALARGVKALVRGGYFFEPSPAPEQTGEANLYDSSRSVFTLGYGLELGAPLPSINLDLFGQMHVLHPRSHTKGESVSPDNPGAPAVETSGLIAAWGATAGVRF
jgi:long-chain fatty acid transport protein